MKSSPTMRTNQQAIEITGTPGKVWGNVLVPKSGTITVKITGDTLQGTVKSGLEQKESWTRIQNIDYIEILEAPIYVLLVIGVLLILSGLGALHQSFVFGLILLLGGVAMIALAIKNKRRCLAIYSHRNTIVVFMNNPNSYQQFLTNVLTIARQLNAPANAPTRQPQTP